MMHICSYFDITTNGECNPKAYAGLAFLWATMNLHLAHPISSTLHHRQRFLPSRKVELLSAQSLKMPHRQDSRAPVSSPLSYLSSINSNPNQSSFVRSATREDAVFQWYAQVRLQHTFLRSGQSMTDKRDQLRKHHLRVILLLFLNRGFWDNIQTLFRFGRSNQDSTRQPAKYRII
jgi:hypothetical protein